MTCLPYYSTGRTPRACNFWCIPQDCRHQPPKPTPDKAAVALAYPIPPAVMTVQAPTAAPAAVPPAAKTATFTPNSAPRPAPIPPNKTPPVWASWDVKPAAQPTAGTARAFAPVTPAPKKATQALQFTKLKAADGSTVSQGATRRATMSRAGTKRTMALLQQEEQEGIQNTLHRNCLSQWIDNMLEFMVVSGCWPVGSRYWLGSHPEMPLFWNMS